MSDQSRRNQTASGEPSSPQRAPLGSLPTAQIELSPEMVRIIKGIAPKKKRSRAPWIVGGLVLALVGIVAANGTLRRTVIELVERVRAPRAPIVTPAPSDSALTTAPAVSAQASATPEPSATVDPVASASASALSGAAPSASASAAPTSTHHHHHAAPRHSH